MSFSKKLPFFILLIPALLITQISCGNGNPPSTSYQIAKINDDGTYTDNYKEEIDIWNSFETVTNTYCLYDFSKNTEFSSHVEFTLKLNDCPQDFANIVFSTNNTVTIEISPFNFSSMENKLFIEAATDTYIYQSVELVYFEYQNHYPQLTQNGWTSRYIVNSAEATRPEIIGADRNIPELSVYYNSYNNENELIFSATYTSKGNPIEQPRWIRLNLWEEYSPSQGTTQFGVSIGEAAKLYTELDYTNVDMLLNFSFSKWNNFSLTKNISLDYLTDYESDAEVLSYQNYINERTFTIGANGEFGTAWLFQRVDDSEYEYYMSTNQHVRNGLRYANVYEWDEPETPCSAISFQYCPSDGSALTMENFKYMSGGFSLTEDKIEVVYDAEIVSEYIQEWGGIVAGIDWAVYRVDFSDIVQDNKVLKDRLEKINAEAGESGNILKFASYEDSQLAMDSKIYSGGFFKAKRYEGTLFQRVVGTVEFSSTNLGPEFAVQRANSHGDYIHLRDAGWWTIGDFAETGYFATGEGMGPGNSGSVVLNTNYEVVGIYTGRTGIYSEVPRYQKIRNTDYDWYQMFCESVGI